MTEKEQVEFINFGRICWRNRRLLLITSFVSAIMGVVISFLLPVIYRSTATVYPAAITLVESTDAIYNHGNIDEFGDIEQAEQLLELASSNDFHERVIQQMELYNHYEIKPDSPKAKFKMDEMYNDLIRVSRSKFSAIKITVFDKSPEKAAKIAGFIVNDLNDFRAQIIRNRIQQNLAVLNHFKDSLLENRQMIADSMLKFKAFGVVSRVERAGLLQAVDSYKANDPSIQDILKANIQYGSAYDELDINYNFQTDMINHVNKVRLQWETSSAKTVSHQFIVEHPQVADKKYSPKRLLVVLGVIAVTLFLLVFYLYLKENWTKYKAKLEA
ncbi:MAG: hypothetical protein H3C31_04990 [Brumimicrobium sp.]|nr:hypothetical protein [Brumimicrobium sp.]MCO5269840.1 Wzz/FepE/Etk N-terminal domain-containing protein [Brumimicrobium sp.]